MQRISTKTTKNPKTKSNKTKPLNEPKTKANANYLSNRSKKCSTSTASCGNTSICSTASIAINNNNKNNSKRKKCIKTVKESKPLKCSTSSRKMQRNTTSATTPLSPRSKSKSQMSSTHTQSTEDDMNEMPVLTPEVPFESVMDNQLISNCVKTPSIDVNYVDLVPPVLSPALDEQTKSKNTTNCEKSKNKRKSKVQTLKAEQELEDSLYQFSDNNSDNVMLNNTMSSKKLKLNSKSVDKKPKVSEINNKTIKPTKNFFQNRKNCLQKQFEERKRFYKMFNFNQKSQNSSNSNNNNSNEPNGWSVDSNHTMSSMNSLISSKQTSQPFMKYRNKLNKLSANGMDCAQNESLLVHNSSIFDNSYKKMPKMFKKSKPGFNSQQMRIQTNKSTKKSLFSDLIGVQKPEPELDEIEGIVFQSFESEESISLFSKFEMLEKEQKDQSSIAKTFKIKSLKSGKVIFPTKTKDITKIKGWREKLFSSIDDKQSKRAVSLCKPLDNSSSNDNIYSSLLFDPTTAQTSKSGSKSAFVSDLLEGYLKTKSDLKLNYLSPDFAAPPDDSPIFSASVLRMPDFNNVSMPPPSTASSSQSIRNKRKGNFGRSKGLKNKLSLKTDFSSDSIGFLYDEDVNSELLLPQYPVIRETLWPETPLSDEYILNLYNEYINRSVQEMQLLKRPNAPSFIMDDHYARYALSALQCNERIPFPIDSNDNSTDDVLIAVGLAPKAKDSPLNNETKITGRYRKDREADLAKIIAMGNRSKRQIRLPSRFHESSLLMGNQWVIPDYDQKGKTGKRRLQQEQKRLQELHQRQLELEQRNQPVLNTNIEAYSTSEDSPLALIHKKLSKTMKSKLKPKPIDFATVPTDYPLKIPHQRLKQMQLIRDQKNQMKSSKLKTDSQLNKSFTSLYSLSTQTVGDKRVLSLSAKAAASATQRAVVNQLFQHLSETINPQKSSNAKNGKLNKLETIKEAIETIEKLAKREQQLCYIRKLLSMWNHKLQLCSKVAQKDMKPEAYKVVNEVMNTYKNSMCYKVGEALEAKRKEFQQKRAQSVVTQSGGQSNNSKKSATNSTNNSQVITIPTTNTSLTQFKTPFKPTKPSNQRLILPKLSPILNKTPAKSKTETLLMPSVSNSYPKLTTPDLHQKNVNDFSVDTELITKEGSLLKPPILTTRPTVLKPFILPSNEGIHSSKSVTGPIINVPNISRIKSMTKSLNICSTSSSSLIASTKSHLTTSNIISSPLNTNTRLKYPLNSISNPTMSCATITSNSSPMVSNSQPKTTNIYSPHSYAGKSVIITSETPLANEDLTKIVATITSNPDNFKKLPVRLSNGMAALTIPGPIDVASTSKHHMSGAIMTTPNITIGSSIMSRTKGHINTNTNGSELKDDSKSQNIVKTQLLGQTSNPTQNMTSNNVLKPNILQKQTNGSKTMGSLNESTECIEID